MVSRGAPGSVTVNEAEAVTRSASDATRFWPPASPFGAAGTVKVHAEPVVPGKLPLGSVAHVEVTAAPSNVKVTVGLLDVNPVPDVVTRLPTNPLVGESITLASTVKAALAVSETVSDATIGWSPLGTAGTVTAHENVPSEIA